MTTRIQRILAAAVRGESDGSWAAALPRIRSERAAIEHFLADGGQAYGFTTRLGHLDVDAAGSATATAFLQDHLHGTPFAVDAGVVRVIAAAKLEQLSHGGSGISAELYSAVQQYAVDAVSGRVEGAWTSSYGAGDVVPAAWWLRAVVEATGVEPGRGDFISAVNGNFISSGVAVLAAARAVDAFSAYLALLPPRPRGLPSLGSSGTQTVLDCLPLAAGGPPAVQAAVSERDATPFVDAVVRAVEGTASAIEERLARPSANPLFAVDEHRVRPLSQNGFLDFGLTFAATSLAQALRLAIGHVQRLIEHTARRDGGSVLVQAPKVAEAVVLRAASIGMPMRFSGALSEGVEDIYDGSLLACLAVLRLVARLEDALLLAGRTGVPAHADSRDVRAALARPIGLDGLPTGVAAQWTEELATRS